MKALAGFLTYGVGYGLIQHDHIREALLTLYSDMAHQHIRGSWMAPETRKPLEPTEAAPYAVPAQLVVPMMARWLLVFEDPRSQTLWLAKAAPRSWLEDGGHVAVDAAPTRWGRVSYSIESHIAKRQIDARVMLPAATAAPTKLRLRMPGAMPCARSRSTARTGAPAAAETIDLPAHPNGPLAVRARY